MRPFFFLLLLLFCLEDLCLLAVHELLENFAHPVFMLLLAFFIVEAELHRTVDSARDLFVGLVYQFIDGVFGIALTVLHKGAGLLNIV